MNTKILKWVIFVLLCSVWGSSFILMKLGMFGTGSTSLLTPFQVAALRMFSAGIVLLPFFLRAAKKIPKQAWGWITFSGLFGNFLPAFLFCIAESRIDSSLTAMLNTLTPICALLVAIIIYRSAVGIGQWVGVITGFAGCLLLFEGKKSGAGGDPFFSLLVVLATLCYGINVNMVRHRLTSVGSLDIAAAAFTIFLLPSALVLFATGFHQLPLGNMEHLIAVGATAVLGIVGTALATVIFYKLVKIGGPVFSSMVTYGIPLVAIVWGLVYGESVTAIQTGGLLVILLGVFIASRPGKAIKKPA